jgi:S1-C subfamily serine protease
MLLFQSVNAVDAVVVLLAVGAATHGLYVGAVVQVLSFLGFAAGLGLSAVLAPHVAGLGGSPLARGLLTMATLVVVTALVTGLARSVGVRVWERVRQSPLGRLDAVGGAALGVAGALLAVWLVAGVVARLPYPSFTDAVQHSAILRALDAQLPSQPRVLARVGRLLNPLGFPDVFAQFEPNPAPSLPFPADAAVRAAVAAAAPSTLKIEGFACGDIQEGSGFVVAPGMVATNAHVVAGVGTPVVLDRAGSHRSTPVFFDPKEDIAVLRVSGLTEPALRLLPSTVGRGAEGVALGYPGGGPLHASPAVVLSEVSALGRDIYGRSLTLRDVYQLRADVRPGNSGGPLVRPDGTVAGVVFARSSLNPDLGFALTSASVRARITSAEASTHAVTTGECAA